MRLVFLGNWGIGQTVLRSALACPGWDVAAVITRRYDPAAADPWRNCVYDEAQRSHVPILNLRDINATESREQLRALQPDLFLVAAYPKLISGDVLAIPTLGAINFHGSLLPKNRGTSPVNWALIRGEPTVGLTAHFIDTGMDTGDLILQSSLPVAEADTPTSLADKIKALAPPIATQILNQLRDTGGLPRQPQNHAAATYAPRLTRADCQIKWSESASALKRLIRGVAQPNLGAWTILDGQPLIVWRAHEHPMPAESQATPGTITAIDNESFLVACGAGTLTVRHADVKWPDRQTPALKIGQQFEVAG
jgi:methionyl-tRNA formyltransferase